MNKGTLTPVLVLAVALACGRPATAQLTPDQAKRIAAAAPARARVAPKKPRTVLVWNTPPAFMDRDPHKGYTIPQGAEAMRVLGVKTGAFRPVLSDDIAQFLPENLGKYDCVVMNNSSGPWTRPTEADLAKLKTHGPDADAVESLLRASLLDWVSAGGGIVAYHYAIGANGQWPQFQALLGGQFTGHPWNEEVSVKVEEPGHPLLAAFGGKDFRIADEIYEFAKVYERDRVRVLLSLDTRATSMNVKGINRKDGDFAQAWVKTHGKGRIFYSGFGHRTETWWNPAVLAFYLDAIQFACGDLDAPTEPRSEAPPGFVPLFDGKSLAGWQGDPKVWSVEGGAVTGRSQEGSQVRENTFLTWKEPLKDFELRLKFRLEGGNSGVYFRSVPRPAGQAKGEALAGMQADFDSTGRWNGVIMEYTLREVLAERGQKVLIDEKGTRKVVGRTGDAAELLKVFRDGEWNHYTVLAQGGKVVLTVNGRTMCELEDRDPKRIKQGLLGLQVHVGPPMTVRFKDIYLREIDKP